MSLQPLVSIGVPLYNEAQFLAEALENLVQQTYPNMEIIIGDNASTDDSLAICARFAALHPNIRILRHPVNIGQNKNFNALARSAKGNYFFWASAHDWLDPTFVEDCVTVLESDPRIVLAYPRTINVTADGVQTREKVRPFDITRMQPAERFAEVMWRVDCNYVYGMFRLQPMLDSHMFQLVPAADRVFLSEMAIKGIFAPVNTVKYYRMNRIGIQPEMEKRHRLMKYMYPDRTFTDAELAGNHFYTPTVRAFRDVVRQSALPRFTRLRLYLSVWLAGVMKFHLFPGADTLSVIVKKILPARMLQKVMGKMQ